MGVTAVVKLEAFAQRTKQDSEMRRTSSSSKGKVPLEGPLGTLLGYRLAKASVAMDKVFHQNVGQAANLRPVEFSVLALAQHNAGIGPARLAHAVAISRPRASQVLDHLAERGLIERSPSAADGRGLEVHATVAANRLISEGLERLQAAERAVTSCLSEAEFGILIELLARLDRDTTVE
jgi:DNA-binding MarR family transcriptional regulator